MVDSYPPTPALFALIRIPIGRLPIRTFSLVTVLTLGLAAMDTPLAVFDMDTLLVPSSSPLVTWCSVHVAVQQGGEC
ncbi:unnamed protein product [Arctogadus glacialis]